MSSHLFILFIKLHYDREGRCGGFQTQNYNEWLTHYFNKSVWTRTDTPLETL